MKLQLTKLFYKLIILLLITTTGYSQKEFFRSQQAFTNDQMTGFASSITINKELILFNANDYHLYAYNKNNGSLQWSYQTNFKSATPVFVQDSIVYAGIYTDKKEQSAQFDLATGKFIKALPFGPLKTKPFIKNGVLYSTAIHNYGCIIAYDLKKDTVMWSRFIAHGYSNQPYYQQNKIMANAEGSNWVALGYDGVLLDTTCAVKPDFFVEGIPCVKTLAAISHDGLEIKGKLSEKIFGNNFFERPDIITTKNLTVILYENKLSILARKLKIKQQVLVDTLPGDEFTGNDIAKLIDADDENTWLLYGDYLLQYNHSEKKVVSATNLTNWQPQAVLLEDKNIWLVSGKDGLLYGLSL